MASEDNPATLVARFLRSNNYPETLSAFLNEAGLPDDAGSGTSKLTIERIIQEKKDYDVAANFEKTGIQDEASSAWALPAPSVPSVLGLPTTTNILCTSVERLYLPHSPEPQNVLLASTADRQLNVLSLRGELINSWTTIQDSPILSFVAIDQRYLVCTSMSGKLAVWNTTEERLVAHRNDHSKYVVQVTSYSTDGCVVLATAGWDGKVFLYHTYVTADDFRLELTACISQPTSPEALLFVKQPEETGRVFLIVARRDSSHLFYYCLPEFTRGAAMLQDIPLTGKQNLAPLSNAWVAFTPTAMALCPKDPTLIAVATSTVPFMKLIIARLLFPSEDGSVRNLSANLAEASVREGTGGSDMTQVQQARFALAIQDRESAAIQVQCNTMASQTQYSSPCCVWRPDGTGVFVNSDDGVIRGIEAVSGRVAIAMQAHQAGSKVRCLWAGFHDLKTDSDTRKEEIVISGGFDQRLILWRPVADFNQGNSGQRNNI